MDIRSSLRSAAAVGLSAGLVGGCVGAGPPPRNEDDVVAATAVAAMEELRHSLAVPGVAMGVVRSGRVRTFVSGTLGAGDARPVSDDTIFEVGSISKVYTAALAAKAQAEGKVSLADRPSRHLSWLRGATVDQATLEQLGTYVSGGMPLQFPDGVSDAQSVREYFAGWKPSHPIGETRRYSNPSIGLFGLSVASAYGEGFAVALRNHVLMPMGLRDTFIDVPGSELGRYSWGASEHVNRVRVSDGPLDDEAYGLKTTAVDLANFVAQWTKPEVSEDLQGMLAPRFSVGVMQQGLGWEGVSGTASEAALRAANATTVAYESNAIRPPGGSACVVNKTGSTNGFGAYALVHLPSRTAVVLLANRNIPIPDRIEAVYKIFSAAVPRPSC